MTTRSIVAAGLLIIISAQGAWAGAVVRDHRGSNQPTYVKMSPVLPHRGGFAGLGYDLGHGAHRGAIVRDHRGGK